MSLLHPQGTTCALGELDLHAMPATQKDVIRSQKVTKTTNNALTNNTTTFDFTFEPTSLYTNLNDVLLYLQYEVVQANGQHITDAQEAAPVNNIAHSLFSSVQMLINGEKITSNNDEYPYKAYMLDLLSKDDGLKETWLKGCHRWHQDTAGHMDTRGEANKGWTARKADAVEANTQGIIMHPHIDILKQGKYLPGQCELRFIFERSPEAFYMHQAPNAGCRINITKAEMSLWQCHIRPEVVEVHNKMLHTPGFGPFNYPIRRCRVTKHILNQGSQEYSWSQPDTSQIPTQTIIGLVKESASSGNHGENPFNFQAYGLKEIGVKYDDFKYEVKTDFDTNNFVQAFAQLYSDTGLEFAEKDCGITPEEFKGGYALYAFDLTPDRTPEDQRINLIKTGKLNLSLRFGAPTQHAISVMVLSFYDNLITLNSDRLPTTDYHMV